MEFAPPCGGRDPQPCQGPGPDRGSVCADPADPGPHGPGGGAGGLGDGGHASVGLGRRGPGRRAQCLWPHPRPAARPGPDGQRPHGHGLPPGHRPDGPPGSPGWAHLRPGHRGQLHRGGRAVDGGRGHAAFGRQPGWASAGGCVVCGQQRRRGAGGSEGHAGRGGPAIHAARWPGGLRGHRGHGVDPDRASGLGVQAAAHQRLCPRRPQLGRFWGGQRHPRAGAPGRGSLPAQGGQAAQDHLQHRADLGRGLGQHHRPGCPFGTGHAQRIAQGPGQTCDPGPKHCGAASTGRGHRRRCTHRNGGDRRPAGRGDPQGPLFGPGRQSRPDRRRGIGKRRHAHQQHGRQHSPQPGHPRGLRGHHPGRGRPPHE